jgi:hypothetical protein
LVDHVQSIKDVLSIIPELKAKFGVKRNSDNDDPLLFCGVATSDIIANVTPVIEQKFGKAYKPAGETAFFKNLFDGFVKNVGGVRTEQTLFRHDINDRFAIYCAFWPWGSNPVNTSIRIGLICMTEEEEQEMIKALKGCFK